MSDDESADEAATDGNDDEGSEGETADGLQEGDFVALDFTAWTGEGDEKRIIDTTDPEVAADEGLDDGEREFEPRTIVLGEGFLFDAVEDAIVGEEVGYSDTVTVPAAEAFGEHDPEEVETVSADQIPEDDRYPGAQVQIDGQQGYLETIIGGRARVDFNHPLAGDDVTYDFEVVDEIEGVTDRAAGLLELKVGVDLDVSEGTETRTVTRLEEPDEAEGEGDDGGEGGDEEGAEPEEVEEEEEVDVLYIEATPELSMNQQWMFQKQQLTHDLMHRFDVGRVVVRETFDDADMHGGGMGGMPGMGGMGMEDLQAQLDDEDLEDVDVEELVEGEGELGDEVDEAAE
jgi:FKBP-type peptidyl-prolyl cis-trans isomerase SlyD